MQLDEAQRNHVARWIADGLKLSEIQSRLASELGVKMTYIEVRFLVDDLKLVPKDPAPMKPVESGSLSTASAPATGKKQAPGNALPAEPAAPGLAGVSVVVDQVTRPGAIVSGTVTFSDGQQAEWYLDQTGRLGVVPKQQGYKPPQADMHQFQLALQDELAKLGF